MAYQVSLSQSARLDLRQIVEYIAQDSPERAASVGRKLLSSSRLLGSFPEMGRIVPEFSTSCVREIVFRPYRIIYRVDHDDRRVRVVRFWHGARGMPVLEAL
jgi:toxin ParE1/3/4